MIIVYVLVAIAALGLICAVTSVRVVRQFERGVVFRFGRVRAMTRGPGLVLMAPVADRLQKVNMQIVTLPVPAQDGIPGAAQPGPGADDRQSHPRSAASSDRWSGRVHYRPEPVRFKPMHK